MVLSAGTLNVTGAVSEIGSALTLSGGALQYSTLLLNSDTVNGPGTLTNPAGSTLTIQNPTINAPLINNGTLDVIGVNNSINGGLTTAKTSVINLADNDLNYHSYLTVGTSFTNNGAINLVNNSANIHLPALTVVGTLTNASGATITASGATGSTSSASSAKITGGLANAGTITVSEVRGLTVNTNGYGGSNSGAINVTGGPLTLNEDADAFTNTGSIAVASGQTLDVHSGTFDQNAGSIGGAGSIVTFDSGTLNLGTSLNNASASLGIDVETVDGPGTLTNAAGKTLTLIVDTINAPLVNQGTLEVAEDESFINGGLTTATSSVINIAASNADFHTSPELAVGTSFTNNGTINLIDDNTDFGYPALTVNGTLTNAAAASIVVSGAGGSFSSGPQITGSLINAGTLTLTVEPGLVIDGNFTQLSTGAVNTRITGGTPIDLRVQGSASFGGSLGIVFSNGFVPTAGESFTVMSYGSTTGSLTLINPTGFVLTGQYNARSLDVTVHASTRTALTKSTTAPSTFGQRVTLTATLVPIISGAGTPTGSVMFKDGSTVLGTSALHNGIATLTTTAFPTGSNSITAVYGGNSRFVASTSSSLTQTVTPSATTTTLTKNTTGAVKFGTSVTFTAALAAVSPGAGTPTGTVTFMDGSTTLGTGTLSGGGATFTTAALAIGSHSVKAVYSGDANFTTSTSGTLSQTVTS